MTTAAEVVDILTGYRFRYVDEARFHLSIEQILAEHEIVATPEVRIDGGRIDLTIGRLGIEVKVDGGAAAVRRQLTRYARSGDFDELLLVTTKVHHQNLEGDYDGVPVTVVVLL